jgi:CBS domain-containing protein
MRARDVMTQPVMTIASDASLLEAVRIMLQNKISGLPVVDSTGQLAGMVTEGDLLRRVETGTQRRRPRWIEFLVGPGRLAEEYVHASGRKVGEVMTTEVHTVTEDVPLDEIVRVMERYRIKRVPVMRGRELVGIVTRASLLRVLASASRPATGAPNDDAAIRERLLRELAAQSWAPVGAIDIVVRDGVVTLSGVITDERQRAALCVAAENVAGVKRVEDRLAWLVPGTGIVGEPPVIIGPTQH